MTICIQCALEEFVKSEGKTDMSRAARFDEEPFEHQRRVHPDLQACRDRRRWLEDEFARIMGGQMVRPEEN
jgi:hypothetical protein